MKLGFIIILFLVLGALVAHYVLANEDDGSKHKIGVREYESGQVRVIDLGSGGLAPS